MYDVEDVTDPTRIKTSNTSARSATVAAPPRLLRCLTASLDDVVVVRCGHNFVPPMDYELTAWAWFMERRLYRNDLRC